MILNILHDEHGYPDELHDALSRLTDRGEIQVQVSSWGVAVDTGSPLPAAVLQDEGRQVIREFGPTAVLALVQELLEK